jgi:hypothetical protein
VAPARLGSWAVQLGLVANWGFPSLETEWSKIRCRSPRGPGEAVGQTGRRDARELGVMQQPKAARAYIPFWLMATTTVVFVLAGLQLLAGFQVRGGGIVQPASLHRAKKP